MFRLTSKVKIAAALAAGALTLGAAGAYAAANANNTITVDPAKSFSLSHGTTTVNLVPLNNKSALTLPAAGFKNAGQCVSWFATNRDYALTPTAGSKTVSKNFHGKLMSGVHTFCDTFATKTDSAETETPDATQSAAPETDSTDSTTSHGNGHGNGHGKHAGETN